jgi:hypothetical protein
MFESHVNRPRTGGEKATSIGDAREGTVERSLADAYPPPSKPSAQVPASVHP